MSCKHCGCDSSEFITRQDLGVVECGQCHYVQHRIQDTGEGVRIFNDNPNTKAKDRKGDSIEKSGAQKDKARIAAVQVCSHLGIDQAIVINALQIYEQYHKNCSPYKSLRARNTEVVMAACIYCQLELKNAAPNQNHFSMDNPKLYNAKEQLDRYCEGKGRNTKSSAFQQQLTDLMKYVNFNALASVESYISEVRTQLDWPPHIANNITYLRKIFVDDENLLIYKQQRLSIQTYTALLFFMMTCEFKYNGKAYSISELKLDQQKKICEKFGMDMNYFKQEAERMINSKKAQVAQLFEKVSIDKNIDNNVHD